MNNKQIAKIIIALDPKSVKVKGKPEEMEKARDDIAGEIRKLKEVKNVTR